MSDDGVATVSDAKPTSANTKDEIMAYLTSHNISFSASQTKDQLLALIK